MKQVYFAGKVDSYRAKLFDNPEIMLTEVGSVVTLPDGGRVKYGGPSVISWSNAWTHGIVSDAPQSSKVHHRNPRKIAELNQAHQDFGHCNAGLSYKNAVSRCLRQIDEADAVHAYIDSFDCYGTLVELGYASAKGKPIYLNHSPVLSPAIHWSIYCNGHFESRQATNLIYAYFDRAKAFSDMLDKKGDLYCYYINEKAHWLTEQDFYKYLAIQHFFGYCHIKRVASMPKLDSKQKGFEFEREEVFDRPDCELWFVEYLPGVKESEYRPLEYIHPDLVDYSSKTIIETSRNTTTVPQKTRLEVLVRDGYRCQYCGASASEGATLEVDHIVPRSKGGENLLWNLQTLCRTCNNAKSNKVLPPAPSVNT